MKIPYLKYVLRFNGKKTVKSLVLSTEANHSNRISNIISICKNEEVKFISLTDLLRVKCDNVYT